MIVFKLDDSKNLFLSRNGESFNEDCNEWCKVVKFFRNGMKTTPDVSDSEAKKFKRLDYIFGPIADGGISRPRPRFKDWIPKAHQPLMYQLCLQSQAMADVFYNDGNNVDKVIFFDNELSQGNSQ